MSSCRDTVDRLAVPVDGVQRDAPAPEPLRRLGMEQDGSAVAGDGRHVGHLEPSSAEDDGPHASHTTLPRLMTRATWLTP